MAKGQRRGEDKSQGCSQPRRWDRLKGLSELFDFRGQRGSKTILFFLTYSQLEVEVKTLGLPDPSSHQRVMCAGWEGLFMKSWILCL